MRITWFTRRIWLEPIQLPFLLSSILFAIYTKDSKNSKNVSIILLSGIFLGLTIFTKIPAFTMIPLVGFLMYTNNNRNLKILGLWFIPVILIPLLWPVIALPIGQFNMWLTGIQFQTHREEGRTLFDAIKYDFGIDPILLILGIAGLVYATIKRDLLLLLWVIPFLLFLYIIDYAVYFHLIPILPAFCIAAARLIGDLPNKLFRLDNKQATLDEWSVKRFRDNIISKKKIQQILPFAIILIIGIFGLVNTTMLITTNVNSVFFESFAFVAKYLPHANNNDNNSDVGLMVLSQRYFWILKYVFHIDRDYDLSWLLESPSPSAKKLTVIADQEFLNSAYGSLAETDSPFYNSELLRTIKENRMIYNKTHMIAEFSGNPANTAYDLDKYPYVSIRDTWGENLGPRRVQIRTNIDNFDNNTIDSSQWDTFQIGNIPLLSSSVLNYNNKSSFIFDNSSQLLKIENTTATLKSNKILWSNIIQDNVNYLEGRLRVISENDTNSNHAGIVWGDGNKEYYLFLRPNMLTIFTPDEKEIASAPIVREKGQWFTLKVVYMDDNNTINIYLNDVLKIQIPNNSKNAHISQVGIRSYNSIAEYEPLIIGRTSASNIGK
jgi:hypothetical protein